MEGKYIIMGTGWKALGLLVRRYLSHDRYLEVCHIGSRGPSSWPHSL